MTKEMYVSSTPHETKVAVTEDDLLAEIFFERENEYTLAGSIYKGRVTRVLPGMQSAFVDIGLERDAFLYVSDFLELGEEEDEFEQVSVARPETYLTHRPPQPPRQFDFEQRSQEASPEESGEEPEGLEEQEFGSEEDYPELEKGEEGEERAVPATQPENVRFGRGRRRRMRRRGFPESKFAHPRQEQEPRAEQEPDEAAHEVPAAYQPIVLPGESISKYQRATAAEAQETPLAVQAEQDIVSPVSEVSPVGTSAVEPVETAENIAPGAETRAEPAAPKQHGERHPFVLPGESISKYRPREQSPLAVQPATPLAESEKPEPRQTESASDREKESLPPRSFAAHPFVLPGESIAKYRRSETRVQEPPVSEELREQSQPVASQQATFIIESDPLGIDEEQPAAMPFSKDVPVAANKESRVEAAQQTEESAQTETWLSQAEPVSGGTAEEEKAGAADSTVAPEISDEQRFEQMNIASVFGGELAERSPDVETEQETQKPDEVVSHPATRHEFAPGIGDVEHEEIEGDETEVSHYTEDEPEDYLELEEETLEPNHELAQAIVEHETQGHGLEGAEVFADADELGEPEFEEEELEPAEYAAESNGRAELRGPSGTSAFQQRAGRTGFDRSRRGRRGDRRHLGGSGRPRREAPRQHLQISDLLKEGQEVLIQIAKEPIAKKGARITSHIALPGRFLVYMPTVNHVGVSRKITSDEERMRLKRIMISEREGGHGGFIVRTAAEGVGEDDLRADIRFLKNLWAEIKQRSDNSKAPALIYHDLNLVERILRDQVTSDFSAIWVDTEQEYERILRFANRFQPSLARKVKLYTRETPLFEQFNIQDEINKALKAKVWLKSGGYIVINQTEALVAIDINTGKYVGKTARLEDTIVKTNIDAIKEIVRQIRLRDLGGIIIIDFIDMDERKNRQKVMQALSEALKSDRAPSKVLAFNDFGLVAITRKRVKHSLERALGDPCPYCSSTGYVKSVTTMCNEIYVELRKMARHLERGDVLLRVNPEVAKALKGNNGRWLQDMEEVTKRTIIVKPDPLLHQEQFDIH